MLWTLLQFMLLNSVALVLAIKDRSELGTRQLLREFESCGTESYGKSLLLKTLPLLTPQDRDWIRNLYWKYWKIFWGGSLVTSFRKSGGEYVQSSADHRPRRLADASLNDASVRSLDWAGSRFKGTHMSLFPRSAAVYMMLDACLS